MPHRLFRFSGSVLLFTAFTASAFGQSIFEVATVKPSEPTVTRGVVILPHADSRLSTKGTTLKDLIQFAYGGLPPDLVVGGPGWCDQARYDILAKPEGNRIPSREEYATMMQALLADRFQLTVHREPRQTSIFFLETQKGDPRIKIHQVDDTNPRGIFPSRTPSGNRLTCRDVSIAELARYLQTSVVRRPVADRTNIKGKYDFVLRWRRDDRPESDDPDLFTAIRDQLGLRLTSGKSAIDFIVVDKAEKPSEN